MGTIAGCGNKQPEPPPATQGAASLPSQPASDYEKGRSGTVQLAAAQGSVEEALQFAEGQVKAVEQPLVDPLQDVIDLIDSAGAGLADYTADWPDQATFDSRKDEFQALRMRAITAANDAIHDLQDADGIVASLLEDAPASSRTALEELSSLIAIAIEDLKEAIAGFGGSVSGDE